MNLRARIQKLEGLLLLPPLYVAPPVNGEQAFRFFAVHVSRPEAPAFEAGCERYFEWPRFMGYNANHLDAMQAAGYAVVLMFDPLRYVFPLVTLLADGGIRAEPDFPDYGEEHLVDWRDYTLGDCWRIVRDGLTDGSLPRYAANSSGGDVWPLEAGQ